MKFFGNSKRFIGRKAVLLNCVNGQISQTEEFPAKIGESDNCALKANEVFEALELLFGQSGDFILRRCSDDSALINSKVPEAETLVENGECTIQFSNGLYILFCGENALKKAQSVDLSRWFLFDAINGRIEDEVPFVSLKNSVVKRGLTGAGLAIAPKGSNLGFFYSQVFNEGNLDTALDIAPVSYNSHAITCPMCYLSFDIGDALSIASHESLRGDTVLGPDEMLRFLPVSFNEHGIALDPMGLPAPDIACPHCRKKLPSGFLDLDAKIFSIVGAPSSGKSYYLSVLIKELKDVLAQRFGVSFKDLDPSGNMMLTLMKNKLFSATTSQDAILAKTAFEGAMYEKYPRFGKMVALPKPLTYSISNDKISDKALVFYDNAGEHFEPGIDLEDSPGAMHVASSAAIFFIFDPASNRGFKEKLRDHPDPQLKIKGRVDQQDTIMSEMEVRIKRISGMESAAKIKKPLAIIINKFDIWKDLLDEPLQDYYKGNALDLSAIKNNSEKIRKFMMATEPSIVSTAESLSENTMFFAVSPLGHTPIKIESGECAGMIAPDIEKLNPMYVEVPTIWAISQTIDGLIETA